MREQSSKLSPIPLYQLCVLGSAGEPLVRLQRCTPDEARIRLLAYRVGEVAVVNRVDSRRNHCVSTNQVVHMLTHAERAEDGCSLIRGGHSLIMALTSPARPASLDAIRPRAASKRKVG